MPSTRRGLLSGYAGLLAALAGCAGVPPTATDSPNSSPDHSPSGGETPPASVEVGPAGPWPTFRGDAANTGVADASAPVGAPTVRWKEHRIPRAGAAPTVLDGAVVAAAGDGTLLALDDAGDERWTVGLEGHPRPFAPGVGQDLVAVPVDDRLVAVDREGDPLWTAEAPGPLFQRPTVADGRVFAGSFHSGVTVFDAADGEEFTHLADDRRAYAPLLHDGTVYVSLRVLADRGGEVRAFAPDGTERWSTDVEGSPTAPVAVADGAVLAGTSEGHVYALEAASGDVRWQVTPGDWVTRGPAVAGDRAFVVTLSSGVVALSLADGTVAWRADGVDPSTAPAVSDGAVLVDDRHAAVVALSTDDGSRRWRVPTEGRTAAPVAVDGEAVYAGTVTGAVESFALADGRRRFVHARLPRRAPSPVVGRRFAYLGERGPSTAGLVARSGATKWYVGHDGWAPDAPAVVGNAVVSGSRGGDLDATEAYGWPDPPAADMSPTPTPHWDPPPERNVWRRGVAGSLRSSLTHADGAVYAGTDSGLVSVAVGDGSARWRAGREAPVRSTPAVADGLVIAGDDTGTVAAHAVDDGTERWSAAADDSVVSSPAVRDGTAYVGADDGRVYALSTADGAERWRFETDGPVVSSPAAAGDRVYVGSADGVVYALAADDGAEVWRFEADGPVHSSPAVADDTVFVGSRDRHLYALAAGDGAERWRFRAGHAVDSSPAVGYGAVVFADQAGTVYALVDG